MTNLCDLFDVLAIITLIFASSRIVDYSIESSNFLTSYILIFSLCFLIFGLSQMFCEKKILIDLIVDSIFVSAFYFVGFYILKKILSWVSSRYS
jgi:hypothetical protein